MVVELPLNEYPRKPPMRPRMGLTKFPEIREKTSTSIEPSFLWAALLYSSHDPTKQIMPAMVPHTRIMPLNPGTRSIVTELAMKAVSRVVIPASSDIAKAAVGLGPTFTAKAHPASTLRVGTINAL